MRRLHLFEFGVQQWLPQLLRDAETGYLATAYRVLPLLPRRWAERISTVFHPGEPTEILDLCSGSGGAMPLIIEELVKRDYDVRARLTDLYPNPKSVSHPRIVWLAEPVDATRVSPKLAGVRTMFSAFHHFRPDAAKLILKDAFERRRAICIFESGSGTLLAAGAMIGVPVAVLALMPFARPFRRAYLVFTYLIPLMPFIVLWDGMVSQLRIYSPEQMKTLTADLQAPDYAWEIGRIQVLRGIPDGLPYVIGRFSSSGREPSALGRTCPPSRTRVEDATVERFEDFHEEAHDTNRSVELAAPRGFQSSQLALEVLVNAPVRVALCGRGDLGNVL